ncbi:hypothetical protein CRV15_23250 [Streptomyces clavuligerus]|nr:hypothetical protein D1794_23885 [Streptomyces clavuligerus]QCS08273.1 hypothetical protein CRV15_23250 [Streptomyces clavuligerus]
MPEQKLPDGVSTYLALTFGTLLSSQGTDASFRPFSPGPPGSFPSVFLAFRRFQLYQILFPPPGLPGFGPSDPAASWTGLSPFGMSTTLADSLRNS